MAEYKVIASFSRNFIFLKTRKTASTSVEIVLRKWCSGRDICSAISEDFDQAANPEVIGRPMNDRGLFGGQKYYNHMTAPEVRKKLPGFWKSAHKFTVERHPYDRVISLAWWRLGNSKTGESFDECLEKLIARHPLANWPIYTIGDHIAVDQVILYDDLWPAIAKLAENVGAALPAEQPRAKGSYRQDRRPAHDVLSDRQKGKIYEKTWREFTAFGFKR